MEKVLAGFVSAVQKTTWTGEATNANTALWKAMERKMVQEHGFAKDAGDIEGMLQKIWMVDLLGEGLDRPGGKEGEVEEEEGENTKKPSVRRSARVNEIGIIKQSGTGEGSQSDLQGRAARGFETLKNVARMASQLHCSLKTRTDILKHYMRAACVLAPRQLVQNASVSAIANDGNMGSMLDLEAAVKGIEDWVGEKFKACCADDKVSADQYRGNGLGSEMEPGQVLREAEDLIVQRYAIYEKKRLVKPKSDPDAMEVDGNEDDDGGDDSKSAGEKGDKKSAGKKGDKKSTKRVKKMKKKAKEYDGPDECDQETEPVVELKDLTVQDRARLLEWFEKDFSEASESNPDMFDNRDSEDMKKVRFLKQRLFHAINKRKSVAQKVDQCIKNRDMLYHEFEMYEDLDSCLYFMSKKEDRYQNLLVKAPTTYKGRDAFIKRLTHFIEETEKRYFPLVPVPCYILFLGSCCDCDHDSNVDHAVFVPDVYRQ